MSPSVVVLLVDPVVSEVGNSVELLLDEIEADSVDSVVNVVDVLIKFMELADEMLEEPLEVVKVSRSVVESVVTSADIFVVVSKETTGTAIVVSQSLSQSWSTHQLSQPQCIQSH